MNLAGTLTAKTVDGPAVKPRSGMRGNVKASHLAQKERGSPGMDLATDFLYSHPPLGGMPDVTLRIGVAFEVGGAYENWGFVVEQRRDGKYHTVATGRTLQRALDKARSVLKQEFAASDGEKCACGNAMAMYRTTTGNREPICMECFTAL